MARLRRSTKPASFKPRRKAATRWRDGSGDVLLRNPTMGFARGCAGAASGHAAAAPPNKVRNSRLRTELVIFGLRDDPTDRRHHSTAKAQACDPFSLHRRARLA